MNSVDDSCPMRIQALLPRTDEGCQFVVYGDCCSGIAGTAHEHNFAAVNRILSRLSPLPEFIAFLGDHIDGYISDRTALLRQWRHFLDVEFDPVRKLSTDIYHVPGNHDVYDEQSAQVWNEVLPHLPGNGPDGRLGRSYFVRRGATLLVVIDTAGKERAGDARFGDREWLDRVLASNIDASHKLVLGHHPAWPVNGYDAHPKWCLPPSEASELWKILKRHEVMAYICSHIIAFDIMECGGILQVTSGGAGTNFGPGGFMPGPEEYHHLVQIALDRVGLRLQVLDTIGAARETYSWCR